MKEILIFAGTTEGRVLSERLAAAKIFHTVCVATDYGEIVLKENDFATVHRGRMNAEEMIEWIEKGNYSVIVDATHPYAEIVTCNVRAAAKKCNIKYLRLKRNLDIVEKENIERFETTESCAKALENVPGNILLTTGSKELDVFCKCEDVRQRLYVRVLPGIESINACMKNGINGKQVIAMQGPFSELLNEAILKQYRIQCMVTKQSGQSGGYAEKIEACRRAGVKVYAIGHPIEYQGVSFEKVCHVLEEICNVKISCKPAFSIILAGMGMGDEKCLTKGVHDAIMNADIIIGSARIIEPYNPVIEKKSYYLAEQIIPYLKELAEREYFCRQLNIVILFSGDSGFYSGCTALYNALIQEKSYGTFDGDITVLPGISSVAYLASRIGESYDDALITSLHGKKIYNFQELVRTNKKIFLLTSGVEVINEIGKKLVHADYMNCEITVGYRLSYKDERIMKLTPKECLELKREGIYTCFIKNTKAKPVTLTHGMHDEEWVRSKVPMTKEEVREVCICKLRLSEGAVVYDIGSGTGSVSVEIARLSGKINVYAFEYRKEAVELTKLNRDRYGLDNMEIIESKAPHGFENIQVPTHVFIGGTGGNMYYILDKLYEMNSKIRIVMTAVTMETVCKIENWLSQHRVTDLETVQMQINRVNNTAGYHFLKAENPIWIYTFGFYGGLSEIR